MARSAQDIVSSVFLFIILLIMFYFILIYMLLIGTFLVKSLLALVLFDSSVIRSFVSRSFSREFDMPIGELECPLRVSIANEHGFSTVYQGRIL